MHIVTIGLFGDYPKLGAIILQAVPLVKLESPVRISIFSQQCVGVTELVVTAGECRHLYNDCVIVCIGISITLGTLPYCA